MEQAKFRIRPSAVFTVPEHDVGALIDAGNGDAALLYLHILKNGGVLDGERAATELHRSDREIAQTAERLCRMGLLAESAAPAKTPPAEEPAQAERPAYRRQDVVRRGREDPAFAGIVDAVQKELGRILSPTDLTKLLGIYDDLSLPGGVIIVLVRYCRQEHEQRYGRERSVSFSYIEKVAYAWANAEILTCEQAEQWVEERIRRRSEMASLLGTLGIRGREPTATERKYLEQWLELGFGEDAIAIAYDRTVTNTGGLKWRYMNSILQSWNKMGLHTPEQIEAGDKKPEKNAKQGRFTPVTLPSSDDEKTLAQMARLRERMKKGSES